VLFLPPRITTLTSLETKVEWNFGSEINPRLTA